MSLDTLLQIGKILRNSKDGLRHNRYIKPVPKDIKIFSVPVSESFDIDFDSACEMHDELGESKLFYLNFKTGDADAMKKYIFGDICQNIIKTGDETNFKLGDPTVKAKAFQVNSFFRAVAEAKYFENEDCGIPKFRASLERQMSKLENLLKENKNIFIHFDFSGKHWYELKDEWKLLNKLQMKSFATPAKIGKGYVLNAYLHRSLRNNGDHRAKIFDSEDQIADLLYAIDYSKKAQISEKGIKIVVLPCLTPEEVDLEKAAEKIEKFFDRKENGEKINNEPNYNLIDEEEKLLKKKEISLFADKSSILSNNLNESEFSVFDFLFTESGSLTSPDYDLIEISGIDKSFLSDIAKRIEEIKGDLSERIDHEFGDNSELAKKIKNALHIFRSLDAVLDDNTDGKKRYKRHMLKVMSRIYTATYYSDDILLPSFIRGVEHRIRNDTGGYDFLKYQYRFLVRLRSRQDDPFVINNGVLEKMEQSESYQIGEKMGVLAERVSKKINSFEKKYVGLLTRRIADLSGLKELYNFIYEKSCLHDIYGKNINQLRMDISEKIKNITEKQYSKHDCAFGFFESYSRQKLGRGKLEDTLEHTEEQN